jgi:hypothetical protein
MRTLLPHAGSDFSDDMDQPGYRSDHNRPPATACTICWPVPAPAISNGRVRHAHHDAGTGFTPGFRWCARRTLRDFAVTGYRLFRDTQLESPDFYFVTSRLLHHLSSRLIA